MMVLTTTYVHYTVKETSIDSYISSLELNHITKTNPYLDLSQHFLKIG